MNLKKEIKNAYFVKNNSEFFTELWMNKIHLYIFPC